MVRFPMHWLLPLALWAGTAAAAEAQAPAPPPRPADPSDAQAPVPPLRHVSALAGYRRHSEAAPIAWKDANDMVTAIGGWRAYAREAAAPGAGAASAPAARTPP